MRSNPKPPAEQGNIVTIRVDAPSAGNDWSLVVPPDRVWRLISLHALLTTDATAVTRLPLFSFLDGSDPYLATASTGGAPASVAYPVVIAPGTNPFNLSVGGIVWCGAPATLLLRAGDRITVTTANLAAADQYSQITLRVEEWKEI
jgi:hypothetical protein